jgi:hypothetical protein
MPIDRPASRAMTGNLQPLPLPFCQRQLPLMACHLLLTLVRIPVQATGQRRDICEIASSSALLAAPFTKEKHHGQYGNRRL